MDVDEAQSKLGAYGKYQMLHYVVICLASNVIGCWHMLAVVFVGIVPEHHCKARRETLSALEAADNKLVIAFNSSDDFSRCFVHFNSSNTTQKCSEWEYNGDVTETIVSKWDLVCDREYLVKMSQSVLVFGVMAGSLLFSPLADMFGRKPIYLLCHWILLIVGFTNAYVNDFYVYLTLRFVTGALLQGMFVIGAIMVCELFSAKQRTFAGIIYSDFWAVATCALALLAYLVPNWRHLQITISLSGLLTIPFYWFLRESVPWLCAKNSFEEAEDILRSAAKLNKVELPKQIFTRHSKDLAIETVNGEQIQVFRSENFVARYRRLRRQRREMDTSEKTTDRYTLVDLIRHRLLRTYAAVMGAIWFVSTYVYYGITLNIEDLNGNIYLNFFLTGLVEIPAYTVSFFIIKTWGRRLPLFGFHILAGVPLIVSSWIPGTAGIGSLGILKTFCVMIGKFGITAAFAIVYLYTPELFPTTLRIQGIGISSFCGRVGNLIAPFATALDVFAPWLSAVVFGTVSVAGGLLVLILPETLNRPLPQSIADIENWKKNKSFSEQIVNPTLSDEAEHVDATDPLTSS